MIEQPLWAPWRMEFIKTHKDYKGCVFCDMIKSDSNKDCENLVVRRGRMAFVVMNRYPYNSGHLLVMPKDHIGEITEIRAEVTKEIDRLIKESIVTIRKVMNPQGFNIGMNIGAVAGAGIKDHLHWHVVPRWQGDTNFMPVLGDSKVISEHLLETGSNLRDKWESLAP